MKVEDLAIKIFADGANIEAIKKNRQNPLVKGFTTNPTLMAKAGITDYKAFVLEALEAVDGHSLSVEVFADDLNEMFHQALAIERFTLVNDNLYIKIPITNTKGESTLNLVRELGEHGISVNVTAIFTNKQFKEAAKAAKACPKSYLSIFAGRIADAGVNPFWNVAEASGYLWEKKLTSEIIWASPRQLYDVVLANSAGANIITVTDDILNKVHLIGKDLEEYSLDTVKMFYNDGQKAGFMI